MPLDPEISSTIEKIQTDLAEQKEANRRHFTVATQFMDLFASFNPKLTFAEQAGRSIGKEHPGWIDITTMPDWDWQPKRKKPAKTSKKRAVRIRR